MFELRSQEWVRINCSKGKEKYDQQVGLVGTMVLYQKESRVFKTLREGRLIERQQGGERWAGEAGMAFYIWHPLTMPNKYIIISLHLSSTHTFHQHCSSNSL